MANSPTEHLLDWLRDAHAMEEQAITMLEAQASRLENYPALRERVAEHLEQTRRQASLIRGCVERYGDTTSGFKDMGGKFMAMMQGLGGSLAPDEVVKGGMASYAFEHLECAAYTCLIAAAEACGDAETRAVCERILHEEREMADWLEQNLPRTVQQFLARDMADTGTAKR